MRMHTHAWPLPPSQYFPLPRSAGWCGVAVQAILLFIITGDSRKRPRSYSGSRCFRVALHTQSVRDRQPPHQSAPWD